MRTRWRRRRTCTRALRRCLDPRPAGGVDREWNRRNLEGFILPYDTAATFVSGSSVLRGKARSARGTESHTLRTGTPTGVLAFRDLEVRMLGRDHALVVGRYVVSDRASARESATGISLWRGSRKGGLSSRTTRLNVNGEPAQRDAGRARSTHRRGKAPSACARPSSVPTRRTQMGSEGGGQVGIIRPAGCSTSIYTASAPGVAHGPLENHEATRGEPPIRYRACPDHLIRIDSGRLHGAF